MTKILVADDHAIIRTAIKNFLTGRFPFVEIDQAWDGKTVLEKIKQTEYNLVVLDVNMPETNSFELVGLVLHLKPSLNILMFSMNAEEVYAKRYLMIGAKGYLTKTAPESEMEEAVETVIKGGRYISDSLKDAFMLGALGNIPINPFDRLSDREFKIAIFLVKGVSVTEISTLLNSAPSTIGTHKSRLFKKLECKNVLEINELARAYNVIPASR